MRTLVDLVSSHVPGDPVLPLSEEVNKPLSGIEADVAPALHWAPSHTLCVWTHALLPSTWQIIQKCEGYTAAEVASAVYSLHRKRWQTGACTVAVARLSDGLCMVGTAQA